MNISEAKQEIKNTLRAYLRKDERGSYVMAENIQRPILLMGPPGIGKTQIMAQIAREEEVGLVSYTITHHTRQSAVGLPQIVKEEYGGKTYSVTEYTMSEIVAGIYNEMKESGKREGILFIDEINCVSETLTPAMLQFLQNKTFGGHKIPEGWVIVAAGNPPEYNRAVRDYDIVTLDRVRLINIEADLEVWKKYANARNLHGAVLSYISLHPEDFYRVKNDVDGPSFVTARGWEDLSGLLFAYEEIGAGINREIIFEYLRDETVAESFDSYYRLYGKYREDYGIFDILKGNASSEAYARFVDAPLDETVCVTELLLDALMLQITSCMKNGNDEDAENVLSMIDNVFEFLENAETKGQEMLIFVTGLTLHRDAAAFLALNRCEKYLEHSAELLEGGRRSELLRELDV